MTPDIFFSLSRDDLNLYYHDTFVRARLPNKEKIEWLYIREFRHVTTGGIDVFYRIEQENSQMFCLKINQIYWDFSIPEIGAYNYKNSVMIVARNPLRQTTKGLCSRQISISNLMSPVASAGAIPSSLYCRHDFNYNQAELNLLFENTSTPCSFEKGITKILKKQSLAFAVNLRISISQGIISKHPSLWLKNRLIGEIDIDKEIIYPVHTAFIPELNNTFLDKGFTVNYEA